MAKTVTEIVTDYLKSIGADGLCNDNDIDPCGCQIGSLTFYDCAPYGCYPAKKVNCKEKDCPSCENIRCEGFKPGAYLMWKITTKGE
jgi:hypothetical protein